MKCYKCGRGIDDGVEEMLPIDPKGTPDRRWACIECAKLLEHCTNRQAMTNGDKIRAMTDEELSVKIHHTIKYDCDQCPALAVCDTDNGKSCEQEIEDWLKRKADK